MTIGRIMISGTKSLPITAVARIKSQPQEEGIREVADMIGRIRIRYKPTYKLREGEAINNSPAEVHTFFLT